MKTKFFLGAVMTFLAIALTMSAVRIVEPGTVGVIVTLGHVRGQIGEGVSIVPPFITSVPRFSIRQEAASDKTTAFSADLQSVEFSYTAMYRLPKDKITDLYTGYFSKDLSLYMALVRPRWEEALKQVASGYDAEGLVKNREKIKVSAVERLRIELKDLIEIIDVQLTDIGLSNELEKSIEAKQVKQQEALAKQYEVQKAEAEAQIILINAKAEAEAIEVKGGAIRENPDVIKLDIIQKWDGKSPSTVVLGENGTGVDILLPPAR